MENEDTSWTDVEMDQLREDNMELNIRCSDYETAYNKAMQLKQLSDAKLVELNNTMDTKIKDNNSKLYEQVSALQDLHSTVMHYIAMYPPVIARVVQDPNFKQQCKAGGLR